MLMDEFKKWRINPDNKSSLGDQDSQENFDIFCQYYTQQHTFFDMFTNLAYQIYELQVCVEGLLEDQQFTRENNG